MSGNGVLRIVGHPGYPNSPESPAAVTASIVAFGGLPGHEFWPDDISLLDPKKIDLSRLLISALVTDSYLRTLAVAHGGQLETFDRKLGHRCGAWRIAGPLPDRLILPGRFIP
jgi:hypothetical protein